MALNGHNNSLTHFVTCHLFVCPSMRECHMRPTVDGGVAVYVPVCLSLVTVNTKTVCCLCQQRDAHQPYR